MFVKILYFGLGPKWETIVECDAASYGPQDLSEGLIKLYMMRNEKPVSEWTINKKEHEVYFMNNEGRTVESWRWNDKAA
jgi:hypothetical protein